MILIYPVMESYDRDTRHVGFFTNKADAEKLVNRAPNYLSVSTPVYVYDSVKDYDENKPDSLKAKALAKLTEADKKVLGLL